MYDSAMIVSINLLSWKMEFGDPTMCIIFHWHMFIINISQIYFLFFLESRSYHKLIMVPKINLNFGVRRKNEKQYFL